MARSRSGPARSDVSYQFKSVLGGKAEHAGRLAVLYHPVAGNVINGGEQLLFAVGRQRVDARRSLVQALDEHQDRLVRLFRANMDSLSRAGGHYTVTAEPYGEHWLLCSRLLV